MARKAAKSGKAPAKKKAAPRQAPKPAGPPRPQQQARGPMPMPGGPNAFQAAPFQPPQPMARPPMQNPQFQVPPQMAGPPMQSLAGMTQGPQSLPQGFGGNQQVQQGWGAAGGGLYGGARPTQPDQMRQAPPLQGQVNQGMNQVLQNRMNRGGFNGQGY